MRISDEGEERSSFFCPRCGATVYLWSNPERVAVPVGAFADPNFPAPRVSVWEERMHPVGRPARAQGATAVECLAASSSAIGNAADTFVNQALKSG